jgi:hypothetical protein
MGLPQADGLGGEARMFRWIRARKIPGEEQDVFPAFPEGRDEKREYGQAVVEIFPEAAVSDHFL